MNQKIFIKRDPLTYISWNNSSNYVGKYSLPSTKEDAIYFKRVYTSFYKTFLKGCSWDLQGARGILGGALDPGPTGPSHQLPLFHPEQ